MVVRLRGEFSGGLYRDSSSPGSLASSAMPTTPRRSRWRQQLPAQAWRKTYRLHLLL